MKVIFKPQEIVMHDAVKVEDKLIGVLTDIENLKQELIKTEEGYILKSNEKEKTEIYESTQEMNIFLKEGDYLVKTKVGFQKPVQQVIEITEEQEKAIGVINNV